MKVLKFLPTALNRSEIRSIRMRESTTAVYVVVFEVVVEVVVMVVIMNVVVGEA